MSSSKESAPGAVTNLPYFERGAHNSCEPLISEAMPCFARAVLTVDEQFFEGVDMAGESNRHDCRIRVRVIMTLEFINERTL